MPAADPESTNCRNVLTDRKIVPDEQIKLFCDILFIRGDAGEGFDDEYARKCYVNRTRPLITKLKFPLSKPPTVVRKLLLPEQSKYTRLCDVHAGLNADFVHQWFKFLALEVGARMEILRSSTREQIGAYAWDAIIKPLTRSHKIWLSSKQVREAFGDFVETDFDPKYSLIEATRQADGCEACILARVGTHINTVWALHTLVRSRITVESHARHPTRLRLLRLLDPWIQHFQDRYSTDTEVARLKQRDASIGLAEELYEKREEIKIEQHRVRRAQRKLLDVRYSGSKRYKKLVKDLDEKAIDDNIYDAENDIIDHYAALRATQRASALLVSGNVDAEASSVGHTPYPRSKPEGKTSLAPPSVSTTARGQPSPYAPKASVHKAYLESRYSISTVRCSNLALLGTDAALDDLNTYTHGLHLSTQYSPVHPDEMAAFEGRYPAAGSHDTTCTAWPVRCNGSRIELRIPTNATGAQPVAERAANSTTKPGERGYGHGRSHGSEKRSPDENRVAPTRAPSRSRSRIGRPGTGKRGESTPASSRERHQLTRDTLQAHNAGIESDVCYRPRDQMSRYSDISVVDDGTAHEGRISRSSTVSASSGYSCYYRRNGARRTPN